MRHKRLLRKLLKELRNPEKYLWKYKDLYMPARDDKNDRAEQIRTENPETPKKIWELVKNSDEIKEILIESGYTEEASDELNKAFRGFFNLSSKFIHRLNRNKTDIIPNIPVSKEDAYLIYTLSLNIVNLLTNKLKRLKL